MVRLASSWACARYRETFRRLLLPLQFGVGESCGVEQVGRVLSRCVALHPGYVVLTVDIANAFNEVERGPMFEAVAAAGLGGLQPYLSWCYGSPSSLWYQGGGEPTRILSQRGVR